MKPSLSREFVVSWHDVNAFGDIKLSSLSNMLQEMAWLHAEEIGVGYHKLLEQKLAWVISRFRLKMIKAPQWLDKITIKTWPSGLNKFFANREFLVHSSNGTLLARATSAWLIIDFNSRRLMKPDPMIKLNFDYDQSRAFDKSLEKIHPAKGESEMGLFPVDFSDLDQNQHVMNTKYIEKAINILYRTVKFKRVFDVVMDYQHETMEGDELLIKGKAENGLFICRGINRNKKNAFAAQIRYD